MLLRKKSRCTSTLNRPRTFEQLELRQLMAVDLGDARLAKNWVPASSEIHLDSLALPANFARSNVDWKQVLTPQSGQLFQGNSGGASFRVTAARYDESLGATHVYLQETLGDVDVVNAYANVTVLDSGRVFQVSSSFVPAIKSKGTLSNVAGVSPERALVNVAREYGWTGVNVSQIARGSGAALRKQSATLIVPALARTEVPFESIYIPKADGTLESGWRLNVQASRGDSWLDAAVSAVDGQVLYVSDWNSDAQYEVFAFPKESPSDGGRTAVVDPQSPVYSPFGWHDTNGVVGAESLLTTGNNTQAYRDTDANNLPDAGSSPSGGAGLVFNPTLDLTQTPAVNADASTGLRTSRHGPERASRGFQL